MLEAAWCILNVIVGIPLAIVLIGACRECLRAIFALAFGFRVFEMKWGAGRRVWAKPIGPVEFVIGALPLVGSIIAESGSPKNHQIARLAQASGPMLIQLAGVFCWSGSLVISEALQSDFAPIATLQIANILLVGLHGLIPFETKTGFRTDIRSILDVTFSRAERNRHARASYYARYARHWLERADVEQAKAILGRGLTQLGRDSLLVACESRILTEDLSSVVDQSECADALRVLIKNAEPQRRKDRDDWSVRERVRQATITSLPIALAALGLFALESERLARRIHHHLIVTGQRVADDRIAFVCEAQLTRWRRWTPALDLATPADPEMERDRLDQWAQLERCRGQLEAAAAHYSRAVSAAQRALTQQTSRTDAAPGLWLANETRLATILRHAAELDSKRNRYRLALVALGRAAKGLDLAQHRVKIWREPEFQARASGLLESERAQLELARRQVLTRMGTR
jgi:hypothetical protein